MVRERLNVVLSVLISNPRGAFMVAAEVKLLPEMVKFVVAAEGLL
jgi:hypothetical protein